MSEQKKTLGQTAFEEFEAHMHTRDERWAPTPWEKLDCDEQASYEAAAARIREDTIEQCLAVLDRRATRQEIKTDA
jgi:hypothetical protein